MGKKQLTTHVTPFGHHAYRAFRECPRRYYYSYLYQGGKESKTGNIKTTAGTVFHAFCAEWHKTGLVKKALTAAKKEFDAECNRWDILKDPDKFKECQDLIARACAAYPDEDMTWQQRNGKLKFLEFEEYKAIELPGGIPFTSRRDAVVQWSGNVFVFETKLSDLTRDRMCDMHRSGGQVSGYVMIEKEKHPECNGALLNHLRPLKTPELHRTPILRSDAMLERWVTRITDIHQQMQEAAKLNLYIQDEDACVTYTTVCPYRDVCACDTTEEQRRVLDTFYRSRT